MKDMENIYDFLGGGWVSVIVAVVLGLGLGYMKFAERRARRERAQKETNKNRALDQANLSEKNQETQKEWDEGMSEIDKIREEAKRAEDQ